MNTRIVLTRMRSRDAGEQPVPGAMVLRAVGPRAGKPTLQHAQPADLIEIEQLPSMRCTASTLAADLKPEQTLDAVLDAVVMRLDDSRSSGPIDELEQSLANDRAHELVIHQRRSESLSRRGQRTDDGSRPSAYLKRSACGAAIANSLGSIQLYRGDGAALAESLGRIQRTAAAILTAMEIDDAAAGDEESRSAA
jgi:hypothetical protein